MLKLKENQEVNNAILTLRLKLLLFIRQHLLRAIKSAIIRVTSIYKSHVWSQRKTLKEGDCSVLLLDHPQHLSIFSSLSSLIISKLSRVTCTLTLILTLSLLVIIQLNLICPQSPTPISLITTSIHIVQ